jgi:RND superfamily putative drug exporter
VVVLFWLGVLIVVTLLSLTVGSSYSNSFSLPKTQSTEALQLLEAVSPKVSGDVEQVVFATSGGEKITDSAVEACINTMLAKLAKIDHVSNIVSPLTPAGHAQLNKDRTVAFATVTFDRQAQNIATSIADKLVSTAESADSSTLHVAVGGQLAELTNKVAVGALALACFWLASSCSSFLARSRQWPCHSSQRWRRLVSRQDSSHSSVTL